MLCIRLLNSGSFSGDKNHDVFTILVSLIARLEWRRSPLFDWSSFDFTCVKSSCGGPPDSCMLQIWAHSCSHIRSSSFCDPTTIHAAPLRTQPVPICLFSVHALCFTVHLTIVLFQQSPVVVYLGAHPRPSAVSLSAFMLPMHA